ncbi:MAG: hypothetical protein ABJB86_13630, partial [Bacteroidota bacterium]
MPPKKKKVTAKKSAVKKSAPVVKKAITKKARPVKKKSAALKLPLTGAQPNTIYIESSAFFPLNSSAGYVDLFQDGRCAASAGNSLATPVVLPVGAVLTSLSVHYMNTTTSTVTCFFLRKHADRNSPSGEIEMSFISLPPATLPPDNYLTATATLFPDGGIIRDRFLHYIEVPSTGNWGEGGKL